MEREGLVFAIVLVGMAALVKALPVPYADEVWLISGLVAGQLAYFIRRDRDERYSSFNGSVLFVVVGAYLLLLKTPVLLSELIPFSIAQLLCFGIYLSIGWSLVKKRSLSQKDH